MQIKKVLIFSALLFFNISCGFFKGSLTRNQCLIPTPFTTAQIGATGTSTTLNSTQAVAIDSSNNVYVGGTATGTPGTVYGAHGSQDAFLVKYNSIGILQWASQLGAAGTDSYVNGLITDSSNNVFATGITAGVLGTQIGTHSSYDLFLTKFNSLGAPVWTVQIGQAGNISTGFIVALDSTGNIYVGGRTAANIGTQYGTHDGAGDILLIKFDASGVLQWASQLGGPFNSSSTIQNVVLDSSSNIFVSGPAGSNFGTQYGAHGTTDVFIAKFSSTGALTWATQFGTAGAAVTPGGFVIDPAGAFYVVGNTGASLGGTQFGSHGTLDAYIAKFDSTGAFLWASQLGSAGKFTFGRGLSRDAAGNLTITGFTASAILGTQFGGHGTQDLFAAQFDSSGVLKWVSQFGTYGNSVSGGGLVQDSCGKFYIYGATTGFLGGTQNGSLGSTDLFISKIDNMGTFQ
jgi:hypothetical protein